MCHVVEMNRGRLILFLSLLFSRYILRCMFKNHQRSKSIWRRNGIRFHFFMHYNIFIIWHGIGCLNLEVTFFSGPFYQNCPKWNINQRTKLFTHSRHAAGPKTTNFPPDHTHPFEPGNITFVRSTKNRVLSQQRPDRFYFNILMYLIR